MVVVIVVIVVVGTYSNIFEYTIYIYVRTGSIILISQQHNFSQSPPIYLFY